MKVKQLLGTGVCIAMLALAGCMDNDVYDPAKDPDALKPESEYFDFTTTAQVKFDVNYGEIGAYALIEIFTEDPVSYNEAGAFVIQGEPVYKIFADGKGRFVGEVELPTAAKSVYVFSPTWGVPMCVQAEVTDGKVTVDCTGDGEAAQAEAATRANADLKLVDVDKNKKIYSLVSYTNQYGKLEDINGLFSEGSLNADFIRKLQSFLWNGIFPKPEDLNNSGLLRNTDHVNTTIAEAYKNEQGETVTVKDADLYFTFLSEAGWYQNVVGYYYYKTGECPSTPSAVKKFVILPNASVAGNVPYLNPDQNTPTDASNYGSWNAPLKINRKVQLLFQDAEGRLSTKFPAGYTIGYFIMPDGFKTNEKKGKGYINTNGNILYSNMEWNNGGEACFISLSTDNGTVAYGVEDGGDKSYEDLLFCIDANPNEAIQDPDRPVIKPDDPVVEEDENVCRSFAFEDIWPTGGDYDLNDVIIEYHRTVTFNKNNEVSSVKETYKPVQKRDAAANRNAFAVQYAADQRGTMSLPSGAVDETQTGSVILFSDVMDMREQEIAVVRTFAAGAMKKSELKTGNAVLNPYIIVNYEGVGKDNRTEVHLPKSKATVLANPSQIGSSADAYYVNKDGKHPFAISIPDTFTPVTERMSIEKEYPDFVKWVESGGKEYTDWYEKYQASGN